MFVKPSQAGRFELPKWADVVKTSKAKELPPSATCTLRENGGMVCGGWPEGCIMDKPFYRVG